ATCTVGLAAAQCSLTNALAPGQSATVAVVAWVLPDTPTGTVLSNSASVASSTPDPDLSNNQTTHSAVTVDTAQADLVITKTASHTTRMAGQTITYTIEVANQGPSDAGTSVVTDPLPSGLTALTATTNHGSCSISNGAQLVECTIDPLPGPSAPVIPPATVPDPATMAKATIIIVAQIDPSATGSVTNTAIVSRLGRQYPTEPVITPLTTSADLAITKQSASVRLPNPTETIEYQVELRNLGPSVARDVEIGDALPAAFVLDSASWSLPSQTGPTLTGTCGAAQPPTVGDPTHQTITCALPDLPVVDPADTSGNDVLTLTLVMHAPAGYNPAASTTETEIVTASSSTADPDLTNNSATWTLQGRMQADLAVTKALKAGQSPLVAGRQATYVVTVTNLSADQSSAGVVLTDTLGPGLSFISSSPPSCTNVGQVITCPHSGLLAPGASLTYETTVAIDAAFTPNGDATNQATVTSLTDDPSLANNTATRTDPVTTLADLAVTTDVVIPGPPGGYSGPGSTRRQTITITNNGPSVAQDVFFSAQIDPDAVIDLAAVIGAVPGTCAIAGNQLVCQLECAGALGVGSLDVGQSATATVTYRLLGSVTPGSTAPVTGNSYQVEATVWSTTPDPILGNNTATAAVTVGPAQTDIVLTKIAVTSLKNTDGHQAFKTPGGFTYQIEVVPTFGNADAQNVVVTDKLPAGFLATSAASTQGSCSITAGGSTVTCALGTIHSGPSQAATSAVRITISGTVNTSTVSDGSATEVRFTNQANLSSSTAGSASTGPLTASALATVDVIGQPQTRPTPSPAVTPRPTPGTPEPTPMTSKPPSGSPEPPPGAATKPPPGGLSFTGSGPVGLVSLLALALVAAGLQFILLRPRLADLPKRRRGGRHL
ncbi:MAG: DUF11 domain-containing protein, partial [Micrococcales bacterium]|nr:DUF11 domain-containing protein [Micrococcales bacterium]